jgi:hypothetical protein
MDQAVTAPSPAPQLTVLMSCYNAARWLDEAVQSVMRQTVDDFEFIVVDDGSQDETATLLQRHAARDSRIVIVSKPNTGLADSLNVGIARARGEWTARLDADDVCEPQRLARQLESVRADADLVFVGSGLTMIDEHGAPLGVHRYPKRHEGLLEHLRQVQRFPPHSSAMFLTAAVRAVGGYRTRIRRAQDWDLWLRLSEVGRLACVDESLVRIRRHARQVTHEQSGRRQRVDSRLALASYWLRQDGREDPVAGDEASFAAFRDWFEMRVDQEGLHAVEDLRARLHRARHDAAGAVARPLAMAAAMAGHPAAALRLVGQRLAGEGVARRLAREWVARSDHSATSPNT